MLARLWNYRPTAASYEGSDSKPGSMWDPFYAYKEKLILNKTEAFKADDVTKSSDIGFFYEWWPFPRALEFKMSLVRIPDTKKPLRFKNSEWFEVVLKHILWLKIRRYASGVNKIIKLVSRVHFHAVSMKQKNTTRFRYNFYFTLIRNTCNKYTINRRTIFPQIVYFNTTAKWNGTLKLLKGTI